MSDEDAQIFVLLGIVAAPDGAQQRPVRQDLARIAQQVDQQIEFLRRQMKLSPTVSDCVRVEIDAKLSGGKNPRSCVSRRLATQGRVIGTVVSFVGPEAVHPGTGEP